MHVIRLREPWEREVVANAADVSESDRPVREAEANRVGLARYRRRFGQPTQLDPEDQIDLVIDRVAAEGQVWLNDEWLGAMVPQVNSTRFCLRGRLRARNVLLIEFALPRCLDRSPRPATRQEQSLDGLAGEVRLEIRSRLAG